MESNPSSKPVTDDPCYICEQSDEVMSISWEPIGSIRIVRHLCAKCRLAFRNETSRIEARKAYELHSAYKHWENTRRAHYNLSNRQHLLPNV